MKRKLNFLYASPGTNCNVLDTGTCNAIVLIFVFSFLLALSRPSRSLNLAYAKFRDEMINNSD
jgi:hypothetical protein